MKVIMTAIIVIMNKMVMKIVVMKMKNDNGE